MPAQAYPGQHLTVSYDPEVCVHAGECVNGLPAVFNLEQDPWIQPDAASPDEVMAQVGRCPSGALQYRTGA